MLTRHYTHKSRQSEVMSTSRAIACTIDRLQHSSGTTVSSSVCALPCGGVVRRLTCDFDEHILARCSYTLAHGGASVLVAWRAAMQLSAARRRASDLWRVRRLRDDPVDWRRSANRGTKTFKACTKDEHTSRRTKGRTTRRTRETDTGRRVHRLFRTLHPHTCLEFTVVPL
jgi:hypothetical protein